MPDINDLPKFSPWPSRLLGLTPFERNSRTVEDLTREFEDEKWGSLLQKALNEKSDVDLATVENWQYGNIRELLGWFEGEWKILSGEESRQIYLNWVSKQLEPWLSSNSIVELGAGYGSVILNLALTGIFSGKNLFAGEYTKSGLRLLEILAEKEGLEITTGRCDFANPLEIDMTIPKNSLIYTSYSATYITWMEKNFVESLSQLEPEVVIHFEPLYEHFLNEDLLSLMRKRYIEVNDYNKNLLTLLRECEKNGDIEILMEQKPGIGSNPLLPASAIAWRPK